MSYPLSLFDKYVIVQQRLTGVAHRDAIGGLPYEDNFVDYITGPDGYGIKAYFQDPRTDDIISAAQHQENTTVTIIVRYDARIKKSMRLKWWDGTEYQYFNIKVATNDKYQNRFTKIQAVNKTEEPVEMAT
jgi:SPP1 family predicted phage head-tail adaptor